MPNPKKRHSKSRRDKRRTHQKLRLPQNSACPSCHEPRLPHRVCMSCGHYNGKQVLTIAKKEEEKK